MIIGLLESYIEKSVIEAVKNIRKRVMVNGNVESATLSRSIFSRRIKSNSALPAVLGSTAKSQTMDSDMMEWTDENYKKQTYEKYKNFIVSCNEIPLNKSAICEAVVLTSGDENDFDFVVLRTKYSDEKITVWLLPESQLYLLRRLHQTIDKSVKTLGQACDSLRRAEQNGLTARRLLHLVELDLLTLYNKIRIGSDIVTYDVDFSLSAQADIYHCSIVCKDAIFKTKMNYIFIPADESISTTPPLPSPSNGLLNDVSLWITLLQSLKPLAKPLLYSEFKSKTVQFLTYIEPLQIALQLYYRFITSLIQVGDETRITQAATFSRRAEDWFNIHYIYNWLPIFYDEINDD